MYSLYTSSIHAASRSVYPSSSLEEPGRQLPIDILTVDDFHDLETECEDCSQFDSIDLDDVNDEKEKQELHYGANEPHPALEYPLLYHMIRRCPLLLEWTKVLYMYRWKLSYPLQQGITIPRRMKKFGVHVTWGEIFLIAPFFINIFIGIVYSIAVPSVAVSGKTARLALIAAFLLAQRNSLVTFLLGMPVDRALHYHKLAGKLGGVTGILHTIAFFLDPKFRQIHKGDKYGGAFTGIINISGCAMLAILLGITISSLPFVRRKLFEAFYYLHFIFGVGLIVGAFFHSGKLLPVLVLLTWGTDLFIRKIYMAWIRNPKEATLSIVSDTVIEVQFPKTSSFSFNPGQYIYLSVPEISWLEWHPFSISSSPNQGVVTLHIRKIGNWTSELYKLAQTKSNIKIFIEGPYGSLSVDIMGDRKYKNVLLISGGIGSKYLKKSIERSN
jgi:predicted ferric reductase